MTIKTFTAPDGDKVYATRDGKLFTDRRAAIEHDDSLKREAIKALFREFEQHYNETQLSSMVTAEVFWIYLTTNRSWLLSYLT